MEQKSFLATEKDGQTTHKIAYYDYNTSKNSNKKVVICAHGLTRNGKDFSLLAERLSQGGAFRVISFDFVGRGNSDWLAEGSKEAYGYPLYVQDALQLLEHLGLKKVDFWIGTSMGGLLAMNLSLTHPDIIEHLILNDIGALLGVEGLNRLMTYVGKLLDFETFDAGVEYIKTIFKPFGTLPENLWRDMAASSLKLDPAKGKYVFNYDPRIVQGLDTPAATDMNIEGLWKAVKAPHVLLVRGQDSDILPVRGVELMKQSRPDLEVIEFPGVGHAPTLMVEDQMAAVEAWMNKMAAL